MATVAMKRWAAYRRMSDGTALLLGTVEAEGEKPAIKAAMATYSLPWRAVVVRVASDDDPAETIRAGKASNPRPWDGTDLVRHELSAMFPDMHQETFARLLESVREHGAVKPVVLHDDAVLDGWHRYRAYRDVGVDFQVEDWAGEYGSPLAFVVAENLARRDLSSSQRAAIAVEFKKRKNAEYKERSAANLKRGDEAPDPRVTNNGNSGANAQAEAAEAFGVSKGYVADAEKIQEASPEVFEQVKSGELKIPQAKEKLGLNKPKAEPAPEPAQSPAPEPKAPPKTIVNGVAKEDPAVEKLRAAGKIPADAIVEIEDPGEDATDVEAVRDEREEQAAKVEADQTDDEWLATLPLSTKLEGVALDRFRRDALLYHDLEKSRRSLKAVTEKAVKERFKGTSFKPTYRFRVEQFLRVEHPNAWRKCPKTEDGGCGGTGQVELIGECRKCFGGGYLVR